MPIPPIYRQSGEGGMATYDFYDLATGTGYKTFYGLNLVEVTTMKYSLCQDTLNSLDTYTAIAANTANDIDFDLPVNKRVVLQGNAIVCVPCNFVNGTGGAATVSSTVYTTMYKYSGTTETQLGSVASMQLTTGNLDSMAAQCMQFTGRIAIPQTVFKTGDTIRLNVKTSAAGASKSVYVFHDPKNYDLGATDNTHQLLINLPFKVDL